ncbi:ATP-binding protein [Streptomyces inhibens]|uniref:ATP-binding protein n=1 Tax=Streptomyces inhibens TaxID=2293571 RepID=UPI001EE6F9C5|nr:ATP-binding protein [Streptomyces inhibens]UKY52169.1 ATP-binding protein [Streptomyces inhibens]
MAYHFPSDSRSSRRARKALCRHLQIWCIGGELADFAELLLSELVTNAVQAQPPAAPAIGVRFALSASRLRLEVRDASGGLPVTNQSEEDQECGRGLVPVDALASGWGVHRDDTGKTVWAELAFSDASAPCGPPA